MTDGPNFRHISHHVSYYAVSSPSPLGRGWEILTLGAIRGYLRRSHARMMAATFALLYALGALTLGAMMGIEPLRLGYQSYVVWGAPLGYQWWNYPTVIILAPWGYFDLPLLPTFMMVLVSIGVGLGMAVAVLLGISLVRSRRRSAGEAASAGTIAGLTPAMISLVTIGACCSTTAASVAGVGVVAGATGTTVGSLVVNNWFLGVFQLAIVWLALFAQEVVLRVYGGILERGSGPGLVAEEGRSRLKRPWTAAALRGALLLGGITWTLTTLAEWTSASPTNASAALWVHWIVQQQLPGLLAILAALFPAGTLSVLHRSLPSRPTMVLRAALVLAGVTIAIGVPPPLASWGIAGLANELLGVLGAPVAWGAVTPSAPIGADLYFRWGVEYLLLGGFTIVSGLSPRAAFSPWAGTPAPTVSTPDPGLGAPSCRAGSNPRDSWGSPSDAAAAPPGTVTAGLAADHP